MNTGQLEFCLRHLDAAESLLMCEPDWTALAHLALVIDLVRRAHGMEDRSLLQEPHQFLDGA